MPNFRKPLYFLLTIILVIPVSLEGYKIYKAYNRYQAILSTHLQNPLPPQEKTVNVLARVGGYTINAISGWASPFAEVSLSSQGVARKTVADETGFFVFNSVSLPDDPKELCLISQDVNQLASFPLCLPPPPRNQNLEIKDILLSPTLSLESGKIILGKTTKASGMTVPNSKVEVYLFIEKNFSLWARISQQIPLFSLLTSHFSPSIAYAANFPLYETKSNENGYFEFSLPANAPSNNRIFVSTIFSPPPLLDTSTSLSAGPLLISHSHPEYYSPKSNTLSFQVLGLWELLKLFLQRLFLQIKFPSSLDPFDPLFIIMIEILILFGLLATILAKKNRKEIEK